VDVQDGCGDSAHCRMSLSCTKVPKVDLFAQVRPLPRPALRRCHCRIQGVPARQSGARGAHFYLGTCYLSSEANAWLGSPGRIADRARPFERQGKANPFPVSSATYFELICHINQAKIYLNLMITLVESPPVWMRRVDRAPAWPCCWRNVKSSTRRPRRSTRPAGM